MDVPFVPIVNHPFVADHRLHGELVASEEKPTPLVAAQVIGPDTSLKLTELVYTRIRLVEESVAPRSRC